MRAPPTATSNFGVGRRESHDASGFYSRFRLPDLSSEDTVAVAPDLGDGCFLGDSRDMFQLPDSSVGLVVTSPPYFAGKEYEESLDHHQVPASYGEFLTLLEDVFAECTRVLEPGGRLAVNVANLGRKPYRSLAADVVGILQDRLGLLLRGEVVWQKADGAAGSCAWGSFRSPANPVLRDTTERVIIASKGRFDRARSVAQRRAEGLPHESTITTDEFMSATLDVWHIEPESAKRVNHPAPFPVQLPARLIQLLTYRGDLVLDPFMGAGATLVAARQAGRRAVGYDLDPRYVDLARARVAAAVVDEEVAGVAGLTPCERISVVAATVIEEAGFHSLRPAVKLRGTGATISLAALDGAGRPWYFDVTGGFTTNRSGLARADVMWRALGRATVIGQRGNETGEHVPLVLLTSHLPRPAGEGDRALRAAGPVTFFDAVELRSDEGRARLAAYAGGRRSPTPGFWSDADLLRRLPFATD